MNFNIRQIIWLLIFAAIFGVVRNKFFAGGIELIGNWRDLSTGEGPIVPPTAEEGDPPFIAVDVAQMEHSLGKGQRSYWSHQRKDYDKSDCVSLAGFTKYKQ